MKVSASRQPTGSISAVPQTKQGDKFLTDQSALPQSGHGSVGSLQCINGALPMSAMGQKQTTAHVRAMSALPPIADMD